MAIPDIPNTRLEMYLDAIAKGGGGGGGSGLPPVTSDDNDMVLTVVNGSWAPANPTSGGVLVANIDPETGTLDKTAGEIVTAIEAGRDARVRSRASGVVTDSLIYGYQIVEGSGIGIFVIDLEEGQGFAFFAATADDYPVIYDGGGDGGGM